MHISSRSGTQTLLSSSSQHFLSKSIDQNLSPPNQSINFHTRLHLPLLVYHNSIVISIIDTRSFSIIHGSKRFPPPRFPKPNYPTSQLLFPLKCSTLLLRIFRVCRGRMRIRLLEGRSRSTSSLRLSTVDCLSRFMFTATRFRRRPR